MSKYDGSVIVKPQCVEPWKMQLLSGNYLIIFANRQLTIMFRGMSFNNIVNNNIIISYASLKDIKITRSNMIINCEHCSFRVIRSKDNSELTFRKLINAIIRDSVITFNTSDEFNTFAQVSCIR